MSKDKSYSKGPWELSDCGEHILGQIDSDDIIEIADLSNAINYKANSKLICAAPEMFEALKYVQLLISSSKFHDEKERLKTWKIVDNAIAKVKGEL